MSKGRKVALVLIVLLLIPITFFGLLYYQMSSLQVNISFEETQVISWIGDILLGRTPNLVAQLSFTNPTFLQVDVSDILAQLYIEDEYALETTIESLFIPAGQTIYKDLTFSISDALKIYNMINQASSTYGGEVKVTITGHAAAHLVFFSMRLPYSITRYFMTKEPTLLFDSAKWIDTSGQTISTCKVNDQVKVQVSSKNPTRTKTITNSIKVITYRDISYGSDEKITEDSYSRTVSSSSTDAFSFSFTPPEESGYHFTIFIDDAKVYDQPNSFPPRLQVSRFTTDLTLDQPPNRASAGSTVNFAGRLLNTETGKGISGATIKIYDNDWFLNPDDLLTSGSTESDGTFKISWTAEMGRDEDNKLDIYAKFEETSVYKEAKSSQYEVEIYKASTTLTLDQPPSSVSVGSNVTFTGKLINNDTGEGITGATIKIYDSDPDFDDLLISGTTKSDGTFSIEWTAEKMDWWDNSVEVYAKFEETSTYLSSQSIQYVITVS